jgi:hypothetical protein
MKKTTGNIDFASFYNFYWFLELADSVIFVVFLLVFGTGRQCDICCFSIGFWYWPTV